MVPSVRPSRLILVNTIATKLLCTSSSNLADMFTYDERMNPIDFGEKRLKVKVTMDIYGKKLVNTIETKPLCASSSNLTDMLIMARG